MANFSSNIDITNNGTYTMKITNGERYSKIMTDLNGKMSRIQSYLQSNLPETYTSLPTNLPHGKLIIYNNQLYFGNSSNVPTKAGNDLSFNNPVFTGSISMGRKSETTIGTNSVALGSDVTASGRRSHAEGRYATASGDCSHAEGASTTASGDYTHAEGLWTTASNDYSHAECYYTTASGRESHAEGYYTIASGGGSHAEGGNTTASGDYSHAEGRQTTASGHYAHAEGYYTYADSLCGAHAEGTGCVASTSNNVIPIESCSGAVLTVKQGIVNYLDTVFPKITPNMEILVGYIDQLSPGYCKKYIVASVDTTNYTITLTKEPEGDWRVRYVIVPDTITSKDDTPCHAEGVCSIATGDYSHAEGWSTTASGWGGSHAEGYYTTASGGYGSHTEGLNAIASGVSSHAEGKDTIASGGGSHAEGNITTASGGDSHAEGTETQATAANAHAEGGQTTASGSCSHAEGDHTTASGMYGSHAEGYYTTASNDYAHAEGDHTTASSDSSHAEGMETTAWGTASHAEGYQTKTNSQYSHAEGYGTEAGNSTDTSSYAAHAEGYNTTAFCCASHAEGNGALANAKYSHAEGYMTTAMGEGSHAEGENTIINKAYAHGSGTYNRYDGVSYIFVIGNGIADNSRSNAFRVTSSGSTYGKSAFNSTGADYAEYFEWEDGNPDNEDRVGLFVTMYDDKIKIANPGDYILGIVSGQPCIIGNADEDWLGRWQRDEYGRFILEYLKEEKIEVSTEELSEEEITSLHMEPDIREENGKLYRITTKVVDYETPSYRFKANPDYDNTQKYIERKDRKEWSAIGMVGVLSVRDDGTCKVNGYCKVADSGIATESSTRIIGETWRVIERVAPNVIKIIYCVA